MYYSLSIPPLEITLEPLIGGTFYLAIYKNQDLFMPKVEITKELAKKLLENNLFIKCKNI